MKKIFFHFSRVLGQELSSQPVFHIFSSFPPHLLAFSPQKRKACTNGNSKFQRANAGASTYILVEI